MFKFYIAGASSRSRTARVYLEYLHADWNISAFLVSPEMSDNEPVVDGVTVLPIEEGAELDVSLPVYLGTRGVNHPKLEVELRARGFTQIIPMNMQLDSKLRNAYLEKYYKSQGREFVRFDMLDSVSSGDEYGTSNHVDKKKIDAAKKECSSGIYVASSFFDGQLKSKYQLLKDEKILQVGTEMTEERLSGCKCFDNTGENISNLNRQFCELTGLYWVWKNAAEDYVGLVHYRRHFLLPEDWTEICQKNGIDVILPVPLYVGPSVAENYRERHIASDWDFVMDYIRKIHPEEYDDVKRILGGNLYCPCNMVIARLEVFDALCSWLFPIIFALYEHVGEREDSYQRRYPGFVSERLITYFFENRRNKYRVVYCNKNFLE